MGELSAYFFFCWFGRCCWLVGLLNKSKVCRHQNHTLLGTMYLTLTVRTVDAGLVFFFPFPFLPPVTLPHPLGIVDVLYSVYCTIVLYISLGRQAGRMERKKNKNR